MIKIHRMKYQLFLDNLGWPVHADVLSGNFKVNNIVSFGHHFLEDFADSFETILILGERITSENIQELISISPARHKIQIS